MILEETRAEDGCKLYKIGVNAIFFTQFHDPEATLRGAERALISDARAMKNTFEIDDAYEPESDPDSNRRCGSGVARHGAARITSGGSSERTRVRLSHPHEPSGVRGGR